MATTTFHSQVTQEDFMFGPYKISAGEVFLITKYSFAFVNLRPIVPDVLVSSKRVVPRMVDLTDDETTDLWMTARNVASKLERHYGANSATYGIQDGAQAGQTVPHVHIHILPRKGDDLQKATDKEDADDGVCGTFYVNESLFDDQAQLKKRLDAEEQRKDRTRQDMVEEATEFRKLF